MPARLVQRAAVVVVGVGAALSGLFGIATSQAQTTTVPAATLPSTSTSQPTASSTSVGASSTMGVSTTAVETTDPPLTVAPFEPGTLPPAPTEPPQTFAIVTTLPFITLQPTVPPASTTSTSLPPPSLLPEGDSTVSSLDVGPSTTLEVTESVRDAVVQDDTTRRLNLIVFGLLALAVLLGVMTWLYWRWTDPQRIEAEAGGSDGLGEAGGDADIAAF